MTTLAPPLRAVDRLFHLLASIAGLLLIVMMLHVTADVAMKYIRRVPLTGTLEIVSSYYMVFAVFLPLGLVEWTRKSIAVDLFYNMFPRPLKFLCIVLVLGGISFIYGMLAWQTLDDAIAAYGRGDFLIGGSTLQVVIWPTLFALPLGFGSAALVTAWQCLGVLIGFDRESWLTVHQPAELDEIPE